MSYLYTFYTQAGPKYNTRIFKDPENSQLYESGAFTNKIVYDIVKKQRPKFNEVYLEYPLIPDHVTRTIKKSAVI